MKVGKNYIIDHTEYMVLDGTSDRMPGQAGLELLADRRLGVGADYVMIFTGTEREPSFLLYDGHGGKVGAGREAYMILARYLRDAQLAPNASEMVRHLGEQALSAGSAQEISCFESRITESFWNEVMQMNGIRESKEIA